MAWKTMDIQEQRVRFVVAATRGHRDLALGLPGVTSRGLLGICDCGVTGSSVYEASPSAVASFFGRFLIFISSHGHFETTTALQLSD
jgi:hypothetical protein